MYGGAEGKVRVLPPEVDQQVTLPTADLLLAAVEAPLLASYAGRLG